MSLQIEISDVIFHQEIKQLIQQLIDDNDNINLKISLQNNKLILNNIELDLPVSAAELKKQINGLFLDEVLIINNDIYFNYSKRSLVKNNQILVNLTENEAKLINFMAKSQEPVTKNQLISAIWQYDQAIQTNIVASAVFKLKQKCLDAGIDQLIKIDNQGKYFLNKND